MIDLQLKTVSVAIFITIYRHIDNGVRTQQKLLSYLGKILLFIGTNFQIILSFPAWRNQYYRSVFLRETSLHSFFIRNPFIRNSTQILKKLRNYTHFLEMIRNFEYSGQTTKKLCTVFFREKLSFRSVNLYNFLHNKYVYSKIT